MKRGNIRSSKIYVIENDKKITKYAVQVRLRGKQNWIQAKKGEEQLIFNTKEEADQVVIDYVEHIRSNVQIKKERKK